MLLEDPTEDFADALQRLASMNKQAFADKELVDDMRNRLLYGGWRYRSDKQTTGHADLWSPYLALIQRYGRFDPRTGKGIIQADCEDQSSAYMAWWKMVNPQDWVEVGILPGVSISHAVGRVASGPFPLGPPSNHDKHVLDLCIYTGMGPMPHGYNVERGEWRVI